MDEPGGASGTRPIRVRRTGTCAGCGMAVPSGSPGWWDHQARALTCTTCRPAPRRAAPERDPVIDELTKAWAQPAVGEERIGAYLDSVRSHGIEVLHDRRIPGSRAHIDHLVIAPTGIWVVDLKRYPKGRLEPRVVGRRRQRELHLFVGSRDKTNLVVGMRSQVERVTSALEGTPHSGVPVHGALCFVGADLGYFARPWLVQGVHVTWREHLLKPMVTAEPGAGLIDERQRAALARHLAGSFRPA